MSLIRQVWALLLAALLLAFAGSVGVVVGATRDALQTQLQLKNSDNATALALALSQQHGDAALMELLMAAQFDTGFYRRIRFVGADGTPGFTREADMQPLHAPGWFVSLLPIDSTVGIAQVSDGWRALGSVQVVSHTAFAHDDLWRGSVRAAAALAAVGLAAALLAHLVVARIRRPLDRAVEQARSLVDGEFVSVPEPSAPELKRLTQAMNTMVARLKLTFEAQMAHIESLRRQAYSDPLTGLSNRAHFMEQLAVALHREDGHAEGGLVLLRVLHLAEVNRTLGRAATDRLIVAVAHALQTYHQRVPGCRIGRLNGSDFALCLPVGGLAQETAQAVSQALGAVLPAFGPGIGVALGAVEMQRERDVAQVMAAADTALARAESHGPFSVELADDEDAGGAAPRRAAALGETAWRQRIGQALQGEGARLVAFPVVDAGNRLIHLECPLRMRLEDDGPFEPAARWLPLALRGRLTADVDARALELALADAARDGQPRCVNLAPASLADSAFAPRLRALLAAAPQAARLISLEVAEGAAVDHFALLQELGRQLRPTGVRLGLEHAGERLGRIPRLFEAGLHYVKLDAAVVRGAGHDDQRATFVRGTVTLLHGLSLQVYAEGVVDEGDAARLWECGVDGQTGPYVSARHPAAR